MSAKNMGEDKVDLKNFERFIEAYTDMKGNFGKIGILGDNREREGTDKTNAQVGLKHEFGSETHPQRSFLRMPLNLKLKTKLKESGAFDENTLKNVIRQKSWHSYLEKFLQKGLEVINQGFKTGGYGKWVPSDMTYKENKETLVETAQLRDSVTYKVNKND